LSYDSRTDFEWQFGMFAILWTVTFDVDGKCSVSPMWNNEV
jgi:hypothetical protein